MSAIAGIVGAPRGVDFDQLPRELSNTFCRRAPDGSSYWRRENVFLFQGLLRTLPEDMDTVRVSQKEGVFLVADVRIDNRADLSTLLDLAASDFNALSDAEVLLECYLKWGEEFLGRIVGDFTLALWDGAAKKFLCARDRVGMRPFYYARGSGQFIFASEAGAVARILGGEASLNRGRVAEYIVREYEGADFESTFFNGVKRLPPGWCVRLQGESFHSWQYWKPDTEFELSDQSDADLIQQTRSLLAQAVQARLRCSGKVGFALSGGMDSSSIIVSARNVLSEEAFKRLSFFSATSTEFKESRIETAAIEAMLEMLGASAHRVESEHTVTFLPFIDAMMDHIVDPFDAGLATIALFSYSTARANGVRAFIDGIDGDTTFFSSTGNVRHLLRSGKFRAAYKANRALASFYEQDPRRKLFREIRSLLLPDVQPLTALRQRRTAKREVRRLLDETFLLESFAREISLEERIQGSSQHFRRFGNSTPREIHASIIYSPNLAVALERYNRVAAFCQVEPRSPLLDRRVLDFCLALPRRWMVGEMSKPLLRTAFRAELPEMVLKRKNFESVAPDFLSHVMKHREDQIFDTLTTERGSLEEYYNLKKLDAACHYLRKRHRDDRPLSQEESYRHEDNVFPVWNAYAFACSLTNIRSILKGERSPQSVSEVRIREVSGAL